MGLVIGGIGPLLGAWVCGWLRDHVVTAEGHGWLPFWSILAGMIAVCFVILAVFYRDIRESPGGEIPD